MAIYSTTVTAQTSWQANADVTIPFEPRSIVIVNEDTDAANYVEVSDDGGVSTASKLTPTILAGIRLTQKVKKIWLKAAAGTPSVQIIAED